MSKKPSVGDNTTNRFSDRDRRFGYLIALAVVICLIAWLMRPLHEPSIQTAATQHLSPQTSPENPNGVGNNRLLIQGNNEGPALTAQEIVAAKLVRFSRSRRDLAVALSRRHGTAVRAATGFTQVRRYLQKHVHHPLSRLVLQEIQSCVQDQLKIIRSLQLQVRHHILGIYLRAGQAPLRVQV